jgi:hypothetical protein
MCNWSDGWAQQEEAVTEAAPRQWSGRMHGIGAPNRQIHANSQLPGSTWRALAIGQTAKFIQRWKFRLVGERGMNYRYVEVLAVLGVAACTTPSPASPEPDAPEAMMAMTDKPVAAEAILVEGNVPSALKESGIVDENTLICKKEMRIGSHIPEIVCVSAAERERLRAFSREYMDSSKRTAGAVPPDQ